MPDNMSEDAEFDPKLVASARRWSAIRDELGMAFRGAQQESYENWCAWEEQTEEGEPADD